MARSSVFSFTTPNSPTDVPNPVQGLHVYRHAEDRKPSGRIVRLHSRRVVTTRPDVTGGARNYKHATAERGWEPDWKASVLQTLIQ